MTDHCIHQLVYLRHEERVLRTNLIEVHEVHVHMPFPSLLFHHHHVG